MVDTTTNIPSEPNQQVAEPAVAANKVKVLPNIGHSAKKSHSKLLVFGILLLVIAAAVTYGLSAVKSTNPEVVFNQALSNGLTTKSLKQNVLTHSINVTTNFNFDNNKDIRLYVSGTTTPKGSQYVEGYGSKNNTYFRFNKIAAKDINESTDAKNLGKWYSIRKDGVLPGEADELEPFALTDLSRKLFGYVVLGNFAGNDQKTLTDSASTNNLYSYDTAEVTKESLDGKSVFVYNVTMIKQKIIDYNKQAAKMFGLDDSDMDEAFKDLGAIKKVKMFVTINDSRLAKLEDGEGSAKITTTYSDFNKTTVSAEPTAQETVEKILHAIE